MNESFRKLFRYALVPLAFVDTFWGFSFDGFIGYFLLFYAAAFLAGLLYGHQYARICGLTITPVYMVTTLGIPGVLGGLSALGNGIAFFLLLKFDPIPPRDRPDALTEKDAHEIGTS